MDKKARIEKLYHDAYEKDIFNGTWLYAEDGKIVTKGALGFRDFDDSLPMREDTLFQLASITKQFTAAAVMLLVREGRLSLEDTVTKFYPELPYPNVTIRNLLTHTGGIPETYDYNMILRTYQKEHRILGSDGVILFLSEEDVKPCFAPGERFEYTNGGYNLLAEIISQVAGVPFEKFLKENVFEPAGMYHTGIYHIWSEGIPHDNLARNMVQVDGKHIHVTDSEDADVVAFDNLNGDDYVYTDIFDMYTWDRALREEKVLTMAEQDIMYTPGRLNDNSAAGEGEHGDGYAFGWGIQSDPVFGRIASHGGGMPGLSTWFQHFVDSDRVMVIMNCRESEDVRANFSLWKAIRAIITDQEPEPVNRIEDIVKDPDTSGWAAFCGKYEHPEEGDFLLDEVFEKDGALFAKAINDGEEIEFHLYPIGENEFGRKNAWTSFKFKDGAAEYDEKTCRKL